MNASSARGGKWWDGHLELFEVEIWIKCHKWKCAVYAGQSRSCSCGNSTGNIDCDLMDEHTVVVIRVFGKISNSIVLCRWMFERCS